MVVCGIPTKEICPGCTPPLAVYPSNEVSHFLQLSCSTEGYVVYILDGQMFGVSPAIWDGKQDSLYDYRSSYYKSTVSSRDYPQKHAYSKCCKSKGMHVGQFSSNLWVMGTESSK